MPDLSILLQQGTTDAWLFVPSAILLGALHGLEPGHSKTMMAAFIVAIRGTVAQAAMLGLAATISHTAVVWAVALAGMHFGARWNAETAEPYFQLASGALIAGVALWMMLRTWRNARADTHAHHEHDHGHAHEDVKWIETGEGALGLEIIEHPAPRFRLRFEAGHAHAWSRHVAGLEIERPDGRRETFSFIVRDGYFESAGTVPEPHEFIARLRLEHGDHLHDYDVEFVEHGHAHALREYDALDLTAPGYQDPHELAHANDIRRRFANRSVTNAQILLFGLTGGLIPCPAAITVLLLCLQLKQVTLGAALVLCFSIGLALTLVMSGVLAALSLRHASRRWSGFGELARKAPYVSGGVILLIGVYVAGQGASALL